MVSLLIPMVAGAADTAPPAPALAAKLLDGSDWSLDQQKGKVVLVNFWASWCGTCRHELPEFVRYYQAHHAEGFELLAIDTDDADTLNSARAMAKGFPFSVTLASNVQTRGYAQNCLPGKGIMSLLSFCTLPHTFLIDRHGNLLLHTQEVFDQTKLDQTVGPLLKAANP